MQTIDQLIRQHMGLVRLVIRTKIRAPHCDLEDLLQEGRIALWRAVRTWDPAARAGFSTYATTVVFNHLHSFVTRRGSADVSIKALCRVPAKVLWQLEGASNEK